MKLSPGLDAWILFIILALWLPFLMKFRHCWWKVITWQEFKECRRERVLALIGLVLAILYHWLDKLM